MSKLVDVKPLSDYRLWLKYADQTEGVVSLKHLVGKGVFTLWQNYERFRAVQVDSVTGALKWSDEVDICPDALYMELTGKSVEEMFAGEKSIDAAHK